MITPTFNRSQRHAVLFTKELCPPCSKTKDYLNELVEDDPDLGNFISVLNKDNHTALIQEYDIKLFPTLIIVDKQGEELDRIGGGEVIRNTLKGVLIAMRINQ